VFDIVLSPGLIRHSEKPKDLLSLKERTRVLRNKGRLICEIPDLGISFEHVWAKCSYDYGLGFKLFRITEKELIFCCEELNLGIVSGRSLGSFLKRFNIPKLFGSRFTSNNHILIGVEDGNPCNGIRHEHSNTHLFFGGQR